MKDLIIVLRHETLDNVAWAKEEAERMVGSHDLEVVKLLLDQLSHQMIVSAIEELSCSLDDIAIAIERSESR